MYSQDKSSTSRSASSPPAVRREDIANVGEYEGLLAAKKEIFKNFRQVLGLRRRSTYHQFTFRKDIRIRFCKASQKPRDN